MTGCRGLIRAVRRRRRTAVVAVTLVALTAGAFALSPAVRAGYHLRGARTALAARDYDRADAHLTRHLRFRPDSGEGHFLLARLSRRMGRAAQAREHLDACRAAGYREDAVALERHLLRAQDGDFGGGAEAVLRRALGDPAERFYVFEALSQGYTKTYRLGDARYCLDRMLEEEPDNVYALVRRGWVRERLGDPAGARDDYRRAVAARPDNLPARRRLAENLFHAGRDAAGAAEHFEAVWAARPDDPAVGVNLAQCRLYLGRTDDARTLLDELLATHPDAPGALLERGKLAVDDGQYGPGEAWLRRAIERDPGSFLAHYALSLCLDRQGRAEEAAACRERSERLKADRARLDELIERASRAPADAGLRYEVAQLFRRFGEPLEAERWLVTALRIDPRHGPAHEALADCYDHRGEKALADRHRLLARAAAAPPPR